MILIFPCQGVAKALQLCLHAYSEPAVVRGQCVRQTTSHACGDHVICNAEEIADKFTSTGAAVYTCTTTNQVVSLKRPALLVRRQCSDLCPLHHMMFEDGHCCMGGNVGGNFVCWWGVRHLW